MEHQYPVADLHDLGQVGRKQQNRRPLVPQLHQTLADELGGAHVDAAGGLAGDEPVSYTHLDVYKRQQLFHPLHNAIPVQRTLQGQQDVKDRLGEREMFPRHDGRTSSR